MMKYLEMNKRRVPIPVPVKTLADVLQWLESYLLTGETVITKIILDGKEVDSYSESKPKLTGRSKLVIQADSPLDISVQTIDSLQNLCSLMLKGIKQCAVQCWQAEPADNPSLLEPWHQDFALVVELLDHLILLLDKRIEVANIRNCAEDMSQIKVAMECAIGNSDWKAVAKILLHKLEHRLQELVQELISMQQMVFESQATLAGAGAGAGG